MLLLFVSCVLWVDEIDKAFAGAQGNGDSGTTSRVLATFITWLSEKTSPVFVVATANNVDCIPAEILRKGRFDEMFFLNLPTPKEREAIFTVHLERFRPEKVNEFQIKLLGELSKQCSGAEIEQIVIEAMRIGFSEEREFTNEDLIQCIRDLVPLARTKSQEGSALKEWSEAGNVTSASIYN
jgi:SpoVK/Ycf46/Vps4 family AAA+-type ATPase